MHRTAILATLAVALGAAPVVSQAQQLAITTTQVTLRAGPDTDYPVVAILPPGAQVTVQGCLQDVRWCDVDFAGYRGWLASGALQYPYQSSYAPLPAVAAVVGIGVLAFVLNDYWRDHYRDRSWYAQRERWVRPPPPPPPPVRYGVRPYPGHPQPYPASPHRDGVRPVPPQVQPVPGQPRPHVQPQPQPQPPQQRPRPLRNDPNSGWDSRHPNAPRADQP